MKFPCNCPNHALLGSSNSSSLDEEEYERSASTFRTVKISRIRKEKKYSSILYKTYIFKPFKNEKTKYSGQDQVPWDVKLFYKLVKTLRRY